MTRACEPIAMLPQRMMRAGSGLRCIAILSRKMDVNRAVSDEPGPGAATAAPERIAGAICADVFLRVAALGPRVQCFTNTVAQAITANLLLAAGARVSMATHPEEVVAMSAGAAALLINLGTIDPVRAAAVETVMLASEVQTKPLVLDPVFVELSPLRRQLAQRVLGRGNVIVRGNLPEIRALQAARAAPSNTTWVTTGAIDAIVHGGRRASVGRGHLLMTRVTGLGCAAGALIAACHAVEPDPLVAAAAALTAFGIAGEIASARAAGPGSFAVALIDALAGLTSEAFQDHHSRARAP